MKLLGHLGLFRTSAKQAAKGQTCLHTFRPAGLSASHKHHQQRRVDVDSLPRAFETKTSQVVMRFVVRAAYLSIAAIAASMPALAFTPEGPFNKDGWFNYISDGFTKHSPLASLIYSVSLVYIAFIRTLGIIVYIPGSKRASLYCLLILVGSASATLTVRNDQVKDLHFAAAGTWIASSLAYHGFVVAWNRRYSCFNGGGVISKAAWIISVVCGIIFVASALSDIRGASRTSRLIVGICEFVCAELILLNDVILTRSIGTRFVRTEGAQPAPEKASQSLLPDGCTCDCYCPGDCLCVCHSVSA